MYFRRWRPNGGGEFFVNEAGEIVSDAEAKRGGLVEEGHNFRTHANLTEAAGRVDAAHRRPNLVESFKLLGMSEKEAKIAAAAPPNPYREY